MLKVAHAFDLARVRWFSLELSSQGRIGHRILWARLEALILTCLDGYHLFPRLNVWNHALAIMPLIGYAPKNRATEEHFAIATFALF